MRLDGGHAHEQPGGDLGVGLALGDRRARPRARAGSGPRTPPGPGPSRRTRPTARSIRRRVTWGEKDRLARGHLQDRGRDAGWGSVLEQEAAGTVAQRAQHVVVGVEGGQHDHRGRTWPRAQPTGGVDTVEPRHPEVDQDDVGASSAAAAGNLVAVRRPGRPPDAPGPVDDRRQPARTSAPSSTSSTRMRRGGPPVAAVMPLSARSAQAARVRRAVAGRGGRAGRGDRGGGGRLGRPAREAARGGGTPRPGRPRG